MEGDAAFRVINGWKKFTDSLWRLSFVETFPVSTLGQDVHAIWPEDRLATHSLCVSVRCCYCLPLRTNGRLKVAFMFSEQFYYVLCYQLKVLSGFTFHWSRNVMCPVSVLKWILIIIEWSRKKGGLGGSHATASWFPNCWALSALYLHV